jgi:hypothetical protein
MTSLHELQQRFIGGVLAREGADIAPLVSMSGPAPAVSLGIYRGNARHNFREALAAGFPVLAGLLGEQEFSQLCWSYQRSCPSPSGDLFHVGARLPAFLVARLDGTPRWHLAEVARLEWLIQECMAAPDDDARFDLDSLAAVPPSAHGALRFRVRCDVRLLTSTAPVFDYWRNHHAGASADMAPTGAAVPAQVLVRRADAGAELQRLSAADHRWLDLLTRGSTLGDALDAAAMEDPAFDAGVSLCRFVACGVINGFVH